MRTITINKDYRKQKQAKIQRETIITPILAEKYKREKREKMNRMSVEEYQKQLNPREEDEQIKLAELLDSIGVFWFHVPNEIKCKPQYLRKRARLGVKAGVLDNFILEPPPKYPDSKGAVIELKRIKGSKVSKEQTFWIDVLKDLGWAVAVCKGYNAAHEQLREWGYIK